MFNTLQPAEVVAKVRRKQEVFMTLMWNHEPISFQEKLLACARTPEPISEEELPPHPPSDMSLHPLHPST